MEGVISITKKFIPVIPEIPRYFPDLLLYLGEEKKQRSVDIIVGEMMWYSEKKTVRPESFNKAIPSYLMLLMQGTL